MIRRFRPYLRPVRGALAAGLAASVVQAAMQWLEPWPLKVIFDSVIGTRPLPAVIAFLPAGRLARLDVLAVAMLAIAVLLGLFRYAADRFVAQAGQRMVFELRRDLFRHVEDQSLSFHQHRVTGDLLSRLSGDVQAVQGMMVNALPTLTNNLLTLGGMLVIMLLVDWQYTLVALSLTPILFVTVRFFLARIKRRQRHARRWEGIANGVAQEVFTSIMAVQAFGREDAEAERFDHASGESLQANQSAVAMQAAFTPSVTFLMTAGTVLVVWFGTGAVVSGHLTPGDLLVFMAYLRGMYSPVRQLAKLGNVVTRGSAAAERLVELLDTDERIPERTPPRDPGAVRGALVFENVRLAYPDGHLGLEGVSLAIPAGARVALVGATGSGKSSLIRLVPRFYDPTAGVVRLDGIDLRDLSLASLRDLVAYVPQEPYLFAGTIWENVAYGGRAVGRDAAIEAARAAGVYDVLSRLSAGFDTIVAERGASLSGGQRQCVALARAMARNPRVLLLDEPTTGLDAQAQGWLLEALERVGRGRTTLIASHDIRVAEQADLVVALAGGRIVGSGTAHEAFDHAFADRAGPPSIPLFGRARVPA